MVSFQITYANLIAPGQPTTITGGPSSATLQLPADAFPSGGSIEINQAPNPDRAATPDTEGPTFEIVSSTRPASNATLSVPFDPSINGPADQVTLAWWSDDTNSWQPVYTSFDSTSSELHATIPHFSIWGWIKKKVLGVSGDKPSCDGTAPSWANVAQTAAGEFGGIVGSCVGTDSSGDLQVRVISDHNGFSYVVFQEKPAAVFTHGINLPAVQTAAGWYALVPPGEVVEADFARPTGPHPTPLYGYGGRDGLTYAGDTLLSAIGFIVGIPAVDVISPALQGCYSLFIEAVDSQLPADEGSVYDCVWGVIKAVKSGVTDTPLVSAKVQTVFARASFWLNVGAALRDFAIAVFNSGAQPTVVDAALSPLPPAPPSLTVSTTSVNLGDNIQISGARYAPNEQITFKLDGATLSSAQADGTGAFSASVQIPAGTANGDHTLTVAAPTSGSQDISISVGSGGGQTPPPDFWKSASVVSAVNNGDGTPPFAYPYCTVPAPPNPCSVQTGFGLVAGGSQVEISGAVQFVPLSNPLILAIPSSAGVFTIDPSPPWTGGMNLFYYSDFLNAITATRDSSGNVVRYAVTKTPDGRLTNAAGQLQAIDFNGLNFSSNGQWMVGASPSSLLRVDVTHLQVFPFGLSTTYDQGLAPNYQFAVTDDGRYIAANAPYGNSGVFVEDMNHCSPPAPNTVVGGQLVTGNQCQTTDVSAAIAAVVPGYIRALPWGFSDDHTLVLYVIYRLSTGITKEAQVTVTSG
jgi:hypothetical protein